MNKSLMLRVCMGGCKSILGCVIKNVKRSCADCADKDCVMLKLELQKSHGLCDECYEEIKKRERKNSEDYVSGSLCRGSNGLCS